MTYPALINNLEKRMIVRLPLVLILILMTQVSAGYLKDSLMVLAMILFLLLLISFNATPKSYTISTDKLVINKPIFDKIIPRNSIKLSKLIDSNKAIEESNNLIDKISEIIKFALKKLTHSTSNIVTCVLIVTKENQKFIINVAEPEEFLIELNS